MVPRRTRWVVALLVLQLVLLVATFPIDALGTETWHHIASLGFTLAVAGVMHRRFTTSRRFLAVGVLVSSVLAAVSGFYLLYFKAGARAGGYQDWGVFWHILWSWFAAVFFIQHTWINRVQFVHFFRRSIDAVPGAVLHGAGYLAVAAALAFSFSPSGRTLFTNESYYVLGFRAWVLVLVPAYAFWAYLAIRDEPPPWLARFGHWPIRRFVDLLLVPTAALAVLSGFPLLFDGPFDARGLKYATKTWHVWPSILFTVLAFVHSVQAWHTVKAHWRAYR